MYTHLAGKKNWAMKKKGKSACVCCTVMFTSYLFADTAVQTKEIARCFRLLDWLWTRTRTLLLTGVIVQVLISK